ncbi:PIN domain-containing protein [Candidatus Bathyarchaeota archaeon]|nr:PIN domain-containing protein [Candidatus Bathyarchaeota archaeon]
MKLLLDTSFILPTLGIDTGEDTRQTLKKLANLKTEIHISRYTLLESLWVAAKLIKNQEFNSERFQLGLRSILETGRYTKVDENPQTFIQALRLYSLGHKDMVDNLLYTTSKTHSLKLLTLDTELKDFITHQGLKDTTIFPNQILQRKEHL